VNNYRLAVIPGDGVWVEVIPQGLRVLHRAGEVTGSFRLETTDYPWSCQWYLEHGRMMPEDGIDRLRELGDLVTDLGGALQGCGPRTRDLGGSATTIELGTAVAAAIGRPAAAS